MHTEVSSFQRVRIEGFHGIQRCPHFRGFSNVYRDGYYSGLEKFHYI